MGPGAGAASAATAPLPALLARVDDLYRRRDDKAAWHEQQRLVQSLIARAPNEYGVLWRAARFYFWASDDPVFHKRTALALGQGRLGPGGTCDRRQPQRRRRVLRAALCMGNYAMGLGVVKALSQGMEGEVPRSTGAGAGVEPGYEIGGAETAWGRFFDKLPWPKRDKRKAEEHLRKAIELNPYALRARVYLASSYLDSDRAPEAKRLLDEVAAAVPGRYDAARGAPRAGAGPGADADAVREAEVRRPHHPTSSPQYGETSTDEASAARRLPRRGPLRSSCMLGRVGPAGLPSGGSRRIGSK